MKRTHKKSEYKEHVKRAHGTSTYKEHIMEKRVTELTHKETTELINKLNERIIN